MFEIATGSWLKFVLQWGDLDEQIKKKRKESKKVNSIRTGGVDEYIEDCPKEFQNQLRELRAAIREVAPDSVETVSYFDMPGYFYEGYEYNGMFVWFSFKAPCVRLHIRPAAIIRLKKYLEKYAQTKAIVSFSASDKIPKSLVKKLVKASLNDMRDTAK